MAGEEWRGKAIQRAWTAHTDLKSWSYYLVGLQAAVADPVTARRMLDDCEVAFGDMIVASQAQADQTAQTMREWYAGIDEADTLLMEDNNDGIPE